MSNKETLKTNNNAISNNNTELSGFLEALNNLPTSGGGSLNVIVAGADANGDMTIGVNSESGFIQDGASYQVFVALEDSTTIEDAITLMFNQQYTDMYEQMLGISGIEIYTGFGQVISFMVMHNVPSEVLELPTTSLVTYITPEIADVPPSPPISIVIIKQ